ncbi:MAG: hypothetical protein E7Z88_04830 [Cyanobacteria bacterium SIG27]|nr:hypothetical protein [Cyanobacteria bacterium SIG27]
MALITKITNVINDIRTKIKPQHLEATEAHYITRKQMFSGFDEFNPTKMDSDDDIIDIGIDLIQNEDESQIDTELQTHNTTTKKVLNLLA